jgi:hypothetical protein
MKITKPVKIVIGLLTLGAVLFPFVIMPVMLILLISGAGFPFFDPHSTRYLTDVEAILPFMLMFYMLMMCYSLVQLGLQIFYVIHEIKNKALTDTIRILFTIGLFFLPYIAMPIYFFAYLWKDAPQEPLVAQT